MSQIIDLWPIFVLCKREPKEIIWIQVFFKALLQIGLGLYINYSYWLLIYVLMDYIKLLFY